ALHPDLSSMEFDELPGEREPKSGALDLLVCRPNLPELLEDRLLILRRDADPRVADCYLDEAVLQPGADVDPSPFGRELQGVGQEVQEHLLHLSLVTTDDPQTLFDGASKPDPAPACPFSDEDQRVLEGVGQVELRPLQLHAARPDLREIEDVVDQRQQVLT